MLEELAQISIDQVAFRLANPPRIRDALRNLPTTLEETIETIDFLDLTSGENAETLLTTPFDVESQGFMPAPTRFSDGRWRVFYSALETATAEAERAHWCRKEALSIPPEHRRFHYRELRCRIKTNGYDFRSKRTEWPFLTQDDTYPSCQALAKEALDAGASTMLCPSARYATGTTAPVFSRAALSEPVILGIVILEIEANGEIQIARLAHS